MAQTIRRLWSVLFPTADMNSYTVDEISEMIKAELEIKGMRSVILYYGYREKSTKDLEAIIRSYNTDETEVVACYLDYIKRIRPGRTDAAATASEKSELHAIMNELKNIAGELNIPIVSGHQLKRPSLSMVSSRCVALCNTSCARHLIMPPSLNSTSSPISFMLLKIYLAFSIER